MDAPNVELELTTEFRTYNVRLPVELTDTATVTQLPPKSLGTYCGNPTQPVPTAVDVFATASIVVALTLPLT